VLIYAHLAPDVPYKRHSQIHEKTIFGKVGMPANNGQWFPHLHIQAIDFDYYKSLSAEEFNTQVDGYGDPAKIHELARHFPDPLNFISLT
jgi:hypothetical protein